mgnify:CR=1 FL=1
MKLSKDELNTFLSEISDPKKRFIFLRHTRDKLKFFNKMYDKQQQEKVDKHENKKSIGVIREKIKQLFSI